MKKITALILTLLMLVSVMSFGTSAATAAPSLTDKLVLHYDFEGETKEEAGRNKAYDGYEILATKTGDLTPWAGNNPLEVTWDLQEGTIAYLGEGGEFGPFADREYTRPFMTRQVEYSFFTRVKLDAAREENIGVEDVKYQFVDMNNSSACMLRVMFVDAPGEAGDYIKVATANSQEVKKELDTRVDVTFEKMKEDWVNIAYVVSMQGGDLVGTLYVSFGTPKSASDWTTAEQTITIGSEIARGTSQMILLSNGQAGGVIMDDLRLYNDNLEIEALHDDIFAVKAQTCAYTVGKEFISFVQLNDENYVTIDADAKWENAEIEGAMGGTALHCTSTQTQAMTPYGGGFEVTFFVPEEGDYTIWGRAYFEKQNANSMFYTIDGGDTVLIWDLPDEDSAENKCYSNWQYFYLTNRVAGTYSDTTKYGEWTIANNEWRHAPNVLHLTAGQHTIRIAGRELGMYLDELVITSYTAEEYDPNNFEGNTFKNDSCKFCGSNWKHFYTDVYAQKGILAQTYFTTVLHTDAVAWTIPEVQTPVDTEPTDTEPVDTQPVDTQPVDTQPVETQPVDTTPDSVEDTAADTTEAPKSGCGATVSMGVLAVVTLAGATVISKKRR